ncbi:MAG TPA: tetratricopeptide repeat protein, partial [Pyrinomonadaceae bacterium]|nr:tetratricopeptide repeat protein [Pyrinomonadaceae bacterium]
VRLNLGLAYYKTKQFDGAEREATEVVTEQPANRQARLLLGLSRFQQGKLPEAVPELEAVYNAQSEEVGAAYALALAYIELDELDKAQQLVDKVFRPLDTTEAHLVVGSYYLATRQFPEAIRELTRAAELNPRAPAVHSTLGRAYVSAHDKEQAAREFKAELEINPNDFGANLNLGWLYGEQGRLDEAHALLQRALELRPGDTTALFRLAQVVQHKGSAEEAVALLERVVKQDPSLIPAHVLLARLYKKLNRAADFERANAEINRLNAEVQRLYQERHPEARPPEEKPPRPAQPER